MYGVSFFLYIFNLFKKNNQNTVHADSPLTNKANMGVNIQCYPSQSSYACNCQNNIYLYQYSIFMTKKKDTNDHVKYTFFLK